ncbi:MAG: sensor histidine kinase [Acidimicrobiales bacterium]
MTEPRPPRRSRPSRGWAIVAAPMLQFVLAGAIAMGLVVTALAVASHRIGEREAIVEARSEALLKAQGLVEPIISDSIASGDPDAVAAVDDVVREKVLSDSLVRVKIWRPDGRVLYSNEPREIGDVYELADDDLEALETGVVDAEVSDLSKPENRYERRYGKLLEVYLPIQLPSGERVLYESYFLYDTVEESGQRIWRSFAPFTIGAVIILQLIQIPLAFSLAQRLRRRQLEREDLLERAVRASEHERRRIAQDLHDGVVQDLAGVSYSLAAIGRQGDDPHAAELAAAGDTVRSSIEALRTLLVELYPPNLAEEGLGPALADLVARARAVGLRTEVDTSGLAADLPIAAVRLVHRTVQEALRNVIAHAGATRVDVRAASDGSVVWAEVVDDGRGFDVERARARPDRGHVGLLATSDLVAEAGGRLSISSGPDIGTTVRIEVPLP